MWQRINNSSHFPPEDLEGKRETLFSILRRREERLIPQDRGSAYSVFHDANCGFLVSEADFQP
jgi:hypothetical protein